MNGEPLVKWLCSLFIWLVSFPGLIAQSYSPTFRTHTYTPGDGLPHSYILSIHQDSSGYLWAGTIYGICRFDGNRFENIGFDDQVPNISINGIIETKNGQLLLMSRKGNLILSGKNINVLQDPSFAKAYPVLRNEPGYFVFELNTPQGVFRNQVHEVVFTDLKGHKEIISNSLPPFHFVYVMGYRKDRLFLYTNNGIYAYQHGHTRSLFQQYLTGKRIYSCYLDSKDRIWISTEQDGIRIAEPGEEVIPRHHITLANNLIAGFYEDREANVWIAGFEGLIRVMDTPYDYFLSKEYPFLNHIDLLTKDQYGNILVFSSRNGLSIWHHGQFSFAPHNPFNSILVDVACADDQNRIWCMTRTNHLLMFDGEQLHNRTMPSQKLRGDRETDIAYDPHRRRIWVAGGHLSFSEKEGFVVFKGSKNEKILLPNLLLALPGGRLLVCTSANQLMLIDAMDQVTDVNVSGRIVPERIHRLFADSSGNIWISYLGTGLLQCTLSDSGLVVQKSFTTATGLKNNVIQSIAVDNQKRIWLATMAGLSIIDLHQNGQDSITYIRHLGSQDGLPAEGLNSSSLVMDDEGYMWYSTLNSIMRFRTNDLQIADNPPKTNIEGIRLNMQDVDWTMYSDSLMGIFQLPYHPVFSHSENTITILSNAVTLSGNGDVQYSYMLSGMDRKWSKGSAESSITFTELKPGKYAFMVRARKSNSDWSTPASFSFTILPALWQTWWFNPFIIALIAGVMYGLFRLRLRQIRKEEKLRRRLASDLHDDIGSSLSSISYYSEAIKQQVKGSTPQVLPLLDKMEMASDNTVNAMSDIVWAINPEQDKGVNLINRMNAYAAEMCGVRNILLEFHEDKSFEKAKLTMTVRKNLYLIFKEAVNNAVKYSGCQILRIGIGSEQDHIVMTIEDNGSGFDPEMESEGNGLKNMRFRAEEIRANLTIHSSPGNGCAVKIKL